MKEFVIVLKADNAAQVIDLLKTVTDDVEFNYDSYNTLGVDSEISREYDNGTSWSVSRTE